MKPPCDEAIVRCAKAGLPGKEEAGRWILVATILASSMAFIDSTVVNVALPALQNSLHADVVGVQWVVESYGLLLGALILVGGSLGDLFGRRLAFLTGVVVFAIASVACGLAPSIQFLILARSVQGVGAAFLVPGSLSIISESFDEAKRGQAIGTWSGFTAITAAAGPVLGGWLIEHASWRWAFFINVPIAAAVIVISMRQVPESRNPNAGAVDWKGTILATLGLGGVVYGFIECESAGWGSGLVIASMIAGCVSLVVFGFVEKKVRSPMVPLALFQSPGFRGANLLTLFLYAALGIFLFLFPMDLIQVQGFSATAAGAAALPLILLMFFLSRWSGGLVARYGSKAPLIVGPLIVAAGFALFVLPGVGANYWKTFFPAYLVLGLGFAISVAPLTTVVMNSVGRDLAGTASGINNAFARIAGLLAIAILGIVMVKIFSLELNRNLAGQPLPTGVLHYVEANEIKLAGMDLPSGMDAGAAAAVHAAISQAFVFGFRTIMWICAALSLASAGIAWLIIPAKSGQGLPTRVGSAS